MNYEKSLSEESGSIFSEGIGIVLYRWSALQLAVENEWGGRQSRQKAQQLHSDIFSWFTRSTSSAKPKPKEPLYIDDLEEILVQGLQSLNTEVDDGSIEEVAEKLMIMHEECLDGNFKSIEALKEANHWRVPVRHVKQDGEDDDSDSDDEEQDVGVGDSSKMAVTVSSTRTLENHGSEDMQVDDESEATPSLTNAAAEDDEWVVVGPKRGRGKRN
ncbi:hypothetical protein CsatB_030952 [Cannabis sativa]|uniref:Pre-rRNA-processing protein TSR2 n=2 Tax=Cannabis sativa TaxID=3483 RepID=A0AB40E818_CANSA|nr:uncharacterized protein LOC115719675 [Cannabis sativa]XP_030504666.1 uncharacterized protein LOC115719675 [Cannabis sativa]XP_060967070.1 uncharacterized protein LOC115719675 [Cannabis sativa]KAF4349063.1 hypothetical protein G4B88_029032 [Cannabis sativa]